MGRGRRLGEGTYVSACASDPAQGLEYKTHRLLKVRPVPLALNPSLKDCLNSGRHFQLSGVFWKSL